MNGKDKAIQIQHVTDHAYVYASTNNTCTFISNISYINCTFFFAFVTRYKKLKYLTYKKWTDALTERSRANKRTKEVIKYII